MKLRDFILNYNFISLETLICISDLSNNNIYKNTVYQLIDDEYLNKDLRVSVFTYSIHSNYLLVFVEEVKNEE